MTFAAIAILIGFPLFLGALTGALKKVNPVASWGVFIGGFMLAGGIAFLTLVKS